ncbi:Ni/Fe hydrogenase subunit alpha [Alienimonas sp. DA493]|uniref:Ni/Fe hydrogenase subunit alpha n=1 Tax=Alienimonas sp. DA493 TaxID=3373605 RepID=UPI0037544F50
MSERSIRIQALTRVEGEGALHVRLKDGRVETVELNIYEPPRMFEAFLRGRPLEEVPDVTARICGICPVAYQMSSVHALEDALGVTVSPEIRALRRLIYCGEWIESHGLHVHLLHAPDFLGYPSGLEMARDHPDAFRRGMELKKAGNELLATFGGRAIHPVNVAVGGFYRAPRRDRVVELIPHFERNLQAAVETARWVAGFDFPDFAPACEMVALTHPDEYPMNEGTIASTDGRSTPVDRFEEEFVERQVPHSTALQAVRVDGGTSYLTGPLARVNLNLDRLSPTARRLAGEVGVDWPCFNPFRSIVARCLEVVHAYEEALGILRNYTPPRPSRIAYEPRAGEGRAATEAPRGLLYHRYRTDADGKIAAAQIVPPTSQNQGQIERDLAEFLPGILAAENGTDDAAVAHDCERLVRSYDPCISCATHFLRLELDRG